MDTAIRTTVRFTIRMAGVCFLVSALFEGMSLTSEVPLFGAVHGGAVAVGYHLLYSGLFSALGIGLWAARRWGYRAMCAGTIVYTLDRLGYVLDQRTLEADVFQRLHGYEGVIDIVGRESIFQMLILFTVLSVVSWWAFLFYLYVHRAYFEAPLPADLRRVRVGRDKLHAE